MAKKKETGELEIRLTTEQANQRLKELTSTAKSLEKQLNDVGKGDPNARRKIVKDLKDTETEILKVRESLKTDQRLIINGEVAGKSVREVTGAIKTLQRELNVIGDDTDPEFLKKARQVAVLQTRLDQLKQPVKNFRKEMQEVGEEDSFTSLKAKADHLKTELDLLTPSTKKFTATATELGQVERRMEFITQQTKLAKGELDKIGEPGSLSRLKHEADELRQKLEKLTPVSKEFAATYIQLDKVEKEIEAIKRETIALEKEFTEIGNVGSFTHLSAKAKALRDDIDRLSPATKEFLTKTQELQKVEKQMSGLSRTIQGQTGLWNRLSGGVKEFLVLGAGYLGLQAFVSQAQNIIRKNAELSDSMADVRQTTGLAENEVQKLKTSLSHIDTRTATKELLDIAKVAGQFGIPTKQIESFTEAINKSTVVLKSEFKGGAEEITTVLATLRNILKDVQTDNIADDLLKIGNAEIVLAQTGAATAPVISDYANRIGGMAGPLGLATDKIFGLGAVLQELGVPAERGGTAVGRVFQKMITNSNEFAKVAGVNLKEYKHLIDTDIYGAFLKFVEGSTRGGTSATAFNSILTDTQLSGNGAREVLAKLSANIPLLTSRVETAGKALKSTSAITDQYNIKNNNFAANIDKLFKNIGAQFSNSSIAGFFNGIVTGLNSIFDRTPKLQKMIESWKEMSAATKEHENTIPPLLAHYSALTAKAHLNQEEQKELKDIIEQIAKVVPSAVTEFDKYGNALGINTQKAKEFIEAQQKLTTFKNKEALEQANIQLKSYQSSIIGIQERLNRLLKDPFEEITSAAGNFQGMRKVTDVELQALRDRLKELNETAEALKLNIRELKGLPLVEETEKKTTVTDTTEKKVKVELSDEELKKLDEFRQKLAQLNIDISSKRTELLKSQEQAELNRLDHTYEQEKLATQDNAEKLLLLEEKYLQDKANIRAHYENKYDLDTLTDKYHQERAAVKKAIEDIANDEKFSDEDKLKYKQRAHALELEIDEKFQLDKQNLNAKFDNERKETEFQQDTKNLLDWHNLQKKEITYAYNERKISKEKYDHEIEGLEQKTLEYKLQLAKDYGKSVLEIEQLIAEGKIKGYDNDLKNDFDSQRRKIELRLRLALEGSQQQLDLERGMLVLQRDEALKAAKGDVEEERLIWENFYMDLDKLQRQHVANKVQQYADAFNHLNSILTASNELQTQQEENDLARDRKIHDEKRKNLDARLSAGKVSRKNYDSAIERLDAEYNAKQAKAKKQQFERNQKAAETTAIINGIVSVTKTFAEYAYPYNLIFAALDAAAVALEVSKISKQQAPEYAKGKPAYVEVGKGGVPQGPSHAEGGIKLIDSKTNKEVGEMEGNEPIYSTDTYKKNKRVMDILMDASLFNGGETRVPISVGDDDGVDPNDGRVFQNKTKAATSRYALGKPPEDFTDQLIQKYSKPTLTSQLFLQQPMVQVVNVQRISENIDVKRFGYTNATGVGYSPSGTNNTSDTTIKNLMEQNKQLTEKIDKTLANHAAAVAKLNKRLDEPFEAFLGYYQKKRFDDDTAVAKANAKIGN